MLYERFDHFARNVMLFANQEAHLLNHRSIEPLHILLGLLKDVGLSGQILQSLNMDLRKARKQAESIIPGEYPVVCLSAFPLSPQGHQVIIRANEEAAKCGLHPTTTEYLLLGLFGDYENTACQLFRNLGFEVRKLRQHIVDILWLQLP